MAILVPQTYSPNFSKPLSLAIGKLPLLFKRLLLALFVLSITRVVFLLSNIAVFRVDSVNEFLWMFYGGLRFDVAILLRLQIVFIALHLLPGQFKYCLKGERLMFFLYLIVNAVLIALNLVDAEYFDFTHKRSTFDLFLLASIGEDIAQLIPMFLGDFWHLIFLWTGLMFLLIWLFPKDRRVVIPQPSKSGSRRLELIISILILSFLFMAGRGKISGSLSTKDAIHYAGRIENIPAVLNTPFCMMESLNSGSLNGPNHLSKSLQPAMSNATKHYGNGQANKRNVVVIILESFSAEYSKSLSGLDHGYMPFLDSLMQEGLHFTNAFANGKKSIEAVPSIMCGVPAMMTNPVITSKFAGNRYNSLASLLSDAGYETAFYHGAANGSMGFEQFTLQTGFEKYTGMEDYPNPDDFDGHWGISDEPFMQFFAQDLNQYNEPFMAGVFTLSSHHPFKIPEQYRDTFPEGPIPMLRTVAYADHALRQFFREAQKQDWYDNTLFILTADHTGKSYTENYSNSLQNYRIPLLFYAPGDDSLAGKQTNVSQQIDILPSVMDYLNLEMEFIALGNSVFQQDEAFAVNYLNGVFQLINNHYLLQYDGHKPIGLYNWSMDSDLEYNLLHIEHAAVNRMTQKISTLIQDYDYRMLQDKWQVSTNNNLRTFYTFNEIY
ncbi:Lipoteichoic acid synthase 1 [Salinivirga cyanobacteriivorans]|uniref:Lipoteichoic acid synthase 1 n=1 Tax=Salinivirga cyanobacteriivorans TaxID=1307839 RepID=A0A0S2HZI7_9BACT|nr:alkaline phosphatase family protein [Salinivirga cyanobacteriivorans]ALO15523.1 Lipoteichoic acid synthase 1 [Salinivirga cyanobacteriivorans]